MKRAPAGEDAMNEQPAGGMPAEHALLGLLALNDDGSGHGYDLARQFGHDAALGNVIRLEPGMVYHHLKKLERLGWVARLSGSSGRPARRPIAITEVGRAELDRWLKAFKSALGCGGVIEDERLVLQGHHRDRVRRLLNERGVRKIAP